MIFLHLDINPPFGLETGGVITSHRVATGVSGDGSLVFSAVSKLDRSGI